MPSTSDPPSLLSASSAGSGDGAGAVLKAWRASSRKNQAEIAEVLGITQQYLSQIERGHRGLSLDLRRRMVSSLGIPAAELGLIETSARAHPRGELPEAVVVSQHEWRQERRWLNGHRSELSRLAMELYPVDFRIEGTGLISHPTWQLERPIELDRLQLTLEEGPKLFEIDGTEEESVSVRPLRSPSQHFDTYTSAIRHLDRPTLFESRPSYRILESDFTSRNLTFGMANYFDKLDLSESVGHELARTCMRIGGLPNSVSEISSHIPFRNLIDDPFNFSRRAVIPAVTTLTLRLRRYPEAPTFLLHWRDPAKVATAGGIYDVIPAGEFQPSSLNPWDRKEDFDIWRNIVREYSEELLGTPEHDGTRSKPINYETWPLFRSLEESRARGKTQVWFLGLGLDALTLATTILTVVVIEDDDFQSIFSDAIELNDEGNIAHPGGGAPLAGVDFSEVAVQRLLTVEPMASPGAACIALAWKHREQLLGMD